MSDPALIDVVARGGAGPQSAPLGRGDWLAAAIRLFVAEGVDAVRILRLASMLDVSRGSFYWHFRSRGELLDAIVEFWALKNTAAVVSALTDVSDLTEGVLALFDAWISPGVFDARLDLAIREWARRAPAIRKAMEQADMQRVEAIAAFYRRCGYPETEAFIRARVLYFTQIGYYALGVSEPLARRLGYVESYFLAFTGRPLAREAADAYRERHLRKSRRRK